MKPSRGFVEGGTSQSFVYEFIRLECGLDGFSLARIPQIRVPYQGFLIET